MTYFFSRAIYIIIIFSQIATCVFAQDWRETTKELIYAPRYFGPNAFPLPELQSDGVPSRWEAEIRGEAHIYSGDKVKDLYTRLFIPVVKGRVGIELCGVVVEDYRMTRATADERHAYATESPITCYGDLIINTYFQLLRSDRWLDITLDTHLKTASGGRLCDARYIDAAGYGFNLTLGKTLYRNATRTFALRAQGIAGFYCWMTNDMVHRQNDALFYAAGSSITYRNASLSADYARLKGYENNGDRPAMLRTKFNFEYRRNILSLRYRHGMKDALYDTYSIAYIRCF
ncbi:MAG: hypothetical protein LBJ23_08695 [Tannerella sp.]|jgi:hypothetical protein|nr:hypothetical protein [Tannerella sp.]